MKLRKQLTQPSDPSYRIIPLTQGQFALVTASDYEWLSQWNWFAWWCKFTKSFYARRNARVPKNERQYQIHMHREILGLGNDDPRMADHINFQTLDNRRSNLRVATRAQNVRYRRTKSPNNPYRGITFEKSSGRWKAQICVDGRNRSLGRFTTAEEAFAAYCDAAIKFHGDFAYLG